ncbi:MAG TPA: UbiA family prenyltransferase [Longimicrobiales bacterium]|nr:UbiA family prenyltransferase [Longimicrobiales bacterium]
MMATATIGSGTPLCVDLDGTLVSTDILWESLIALVRHQPWALALLPAWLLGGKAHFKRKLAERIVVDPATLPYRDKVLDMLRAEHAAGREIVLTTASDAGPAQAIAHHLGIFSAVYASDGITNLSGSAKLDAIRKHVAGGRFDYIGDARADLVIWKAAREAILVDPSSRLLGEAKRHVRVDRVMRSESARLRALIRALRPHQWVKNTLLFMPLMLSHKLGNTAVFGQALIAFAAFSLAASSVYVTNDLLDLEADRAHPRKRRRPFASGALSIRTGVLLVPVLLGLAFTTAALFLPPLFTVGLVAYVVLSSAYSLYIKRLVLLDVFMLAGLYTLRVLAGGLATGIEISPWLAAFSMFFFTSLAFLKRYSELLLLGEHQQTQFHRRDYAASDMDLLRSLGSACGFVSVLVLALYINSPAVFELYERPSALWLVVPLFLYWVSRIWLFGHRGKVQDDPIVFAIKDPASYVIAVLIAAIMVLATL